MEALNLAIKHFGSKAALARALDVTPMAVHQWLVRKRVPIERVVPIELATKGEVTRQMLRPDVFTEAA